MNIEMLNVSNKAKSEIPSARVSSKDNGFSKELTKANSVVSKRDQVDSSQKNAVKGISNKQVVNDSKSEKVQDNLQVQETPEDKETKATSSTVKVDISKGLEGLLGSVSKLVNDSNGEQKISFEDLTSILNASSLQELGNAIGIKIDQQDFSAGISLENILKTLGIKKEDLQKALQQLTGDQSKAEDVWDMLVGIDQNQSSFIQNLMTSINGDSNSKISKSQASQVLQVLKMVELVAPKTDLMLKQEYQTFQVKELISTLSSKIEQTHATSNETSPSLLKTNDAQQQINLKQINIKLADTSANENVSTIQTTTKAESTTVTFTLPTNKASQAEAFVKEFQAIMNRGQFSNNAAGTKLLIKLYPENLGSIRVELVQKDGMMTARFLASTNIGKQMLESQLQQLKQGLVNQNIQLDRIDVAQALNETNRHEKEHQQFQHAFRQHSNEQQKQKKDEEEKSNFNDFLMELEV